MTALSRLLAADWENQDLGLDHIRSRTKLMVEFLRRIALWSDAYDVPPQRHWPFIDLGTYVAPDLRAAPDVLDRLTEVETYLGRYEARRAAEAALHWDVVKGAADLPDLPDPYEPYLLFLERGGGFYIDKGLFIDFYAAVPMKRPQDWRDRKPVPIDPASLDAYDTA
ncbi:hypothetical protein [Kibdelosporangium phytohabitans]|uniref:Uncharacterized protein n=1 Tax=Kibdelosporangium phytohabitans TaxID=860235 RepID=A0A0N9ICZ7_9PSEU|nr:hypothetical protein [Kibdelosporangium phytohabitans]ALG14338.1 hypothetical protein AOZ06_52380 [Kibdelosporangium phytohabitans]MBE1466640.1 hypothetical protein [Kibdelosporangium phytohabitans]